MPRTLVIIQSNYIPWKGYFDLLLQADHIIIYDTVQYTKNDWRNRNKIKTENGLKWLTIPVIHESLDQKICDVKISDNLWYQRHLDSLHQAYKKSPYFKSFFQDIRILYESLKDECYLSQVNIQILCFILEKLGKRKILDHSKNYELKSSKTGNLIELCEYTKCDTYLSGPSAKSYIDPVLFSNAGIDLKYIDYKGYKEYEQIHGTFEHGVSILDLFFHLGEKTSEYITK